MSLARAMHVQHLSAWLVIAPQLMGRFVRPRLSTVSAMRKLSAICVMVATVSACESGPPSDEASVRDSAGIRIVEYTAVPPKVGALTLSAEPLYQHGGAPGDYQFQMISLGALQPDGSAIVVDAAVQEVLRIKHDGTSHTVLARRGRGPSEVQRVSSIMVLGQDTVLIEDDGNTRISVFEPGGVVRSTNLGGDPSITRGLRALGITNAGQLLMSTSSYRSGFTEPWLTGHLVRFEVETQAADTVASFDMAPFTPREGTQNPFLPTGKATATQGRFVVARSDRAEIRWLSADGVLEQVVRWNPQPIYPGQADWEAFVNLLRVDLRRVNPQMSGEEFRRFINRQLQRYELNTDEPMPLFGSLHSDADGRVWLADYVALGGLAGVSRYTIVDQDGSWLGGLEWPEAFRFLDAAYGRVLGVMRDQDDVQRVVVYALEGGGS